ncbi:MAG: mucoidy inhibitor MuiA family protein [Pseudomonadota bacterium]
MRAFLLASVVMVPGLLAAEEFPTALPVTSAEVFPFGAFTQAQVTLDLPAGDHSILVLLDPADAGSRQIRPVLDGAILSAVSIGPNIGHDPAQFDTPAVDAARDVRDAAQTTLAALEEEGRALDAQIAALDAQAAFLRSVTGGDTLADADALLAVTGAIGDQLVTLAADRRALDAAKDELREGLERAAAALTRSEVALDALRPARDTWQLMTLRVQVPDAGPVTVRLPGFDPTARWSIGYDVRLDENAATVEFGRTVTVAHEGQPWVDTAVKLSTASLTERLDATEVRRSIARIFEALPMASMRNGAMSEPVMEAAIMADVFETASVDADGAVIRYDLPRLVTLLPGSEGAQVALEPLRFEADPYLLAAPRFDDTAFLMADFANTSGEPMLAGETIVYRGATLVGTGALPLVPAGAETTVGFGPERSLALSVTFLDQQEGDRGIIRGQATREDRVRLEARNLGDAARDVRLRYAVPTSQQEDLEVRVTMDPTPDTRDLDDQLGVMEWELSIPAGGAEQIDLSFDLRWPEDQNLNWRP